MGNFRDPHICQCLTRIATLKGSSPLTISGDRRKTGQQFVDCVLCLANGLIHIGMTPGDVVAMSAYNSDWYLEWLLAIAFVGGIIAPLNYRWSLDEARFAMLLVKPVMLVTDESSSNWSFEIQNNDIPSLKWHVSMNSLPSEFPEKGKVWTTDMLKRTPMRLLPSNYLWAPESAVLICFTSGTTGRPQGVTITHSAILIQSMAKIAICGYGGTDVYMHIAPLCHIGSLSSACAMLMVGACHVLPPKFDAKSCLHLIQQHRVTSFITVPTMVADLISLLRDMRCWEGSRYVKKILNGGGSLSPKLLFEAKIFFPKAKILSAYGMTETCSSMTFMTLYDPTLHTSEQHLEKLVARDLKPIGKQRGVCVGIPAPHVEIRTDTDDSLSAGHILTRGPHLMMKYWSQLPTVDQSSRLWFNTGDIGFIDENGNLWLIGREWGRIKTGGENVFPEEVEAVLIHHPAINGIVIVGIPEERLGEMVVGCIQLKEDWQWSETGFAHKSGSNNNILSSEILHSYCRAKNLTGFKIPKVFLSWKKPFPRTSTGKIQRVRVREEAIYYLQRLHSNL